MPALAVGAVAVVHAFVSFVEAHGRRRREAILAAAASALDVAAADGAFTLTGLCRGMPATFTLRGAAAHVEIDLPAAELVFSIQPRFVSPGGAPEPGVVLTGDDDFDSLVRVEGAPADIVRCVLAPSLRAQILACQPLDLAVNGTTAMAVGPAEEPSDVRGLIALTGALAAAIPSALEEADRRLLEATGSPYRPELDATAMRAARGLRTVELATHTELLLDRDAAARRAVLLTTVLGAILVLSLYASG